MQVSQYLFQSPSSNQVQIGRPDPSAQKEEIADKVSQNTKEFDTQKIKELEKQNPIYLLDTYA
jgi:hypothetical protein